MPEVTSAEHEVHFGNSVAPELVVASAVYHLFVFSLKGLAPSRLTRKAMNGLRVGPLSWYLEFTKNLER